MSTLIPTTFKFPGGLALKARRVAIVGSFNGWNATGHPLMKTPDGDWAITVYFPAGRIVYGFDVDGVFWLDPFDEARMPNGWGSEYSIRYVRRGASSRSRFADDLGARHSNALSSEEGARSSFIGKRRWRGVGATPGLVSHRGRSGVVQG